MSKTWKDSSQKKERDERFFSSNRNKKNKVSPTKGGKKPKRINKYDDEEYVDYGE